MLVAALALVMMLWTNHRAWSAHIHMAIQVMVLIMLVIVTVMTSIIMIQP